jgi:hypothetical protein
MVARTITPNIQHLRGKASAPRAAASLSETHPGTFKTCQKIIILLNRWIVTIGAFLSAAHHLYCFPLNTWSAYVAKGCMLIFSSLGRFQLVLVMVEN